tara:strand:+ start:514 stop:1257 length:744 start_codon:yes stop_codon:yes gene_type:complete
MKYKGSTTPQGQKPMLKDFDVGPVSAWSYSALKVFEECPYRTYIARVKRIKEPSGPAAERGTEIHLQAEQYIKGELAEMPITLKKFEDEFEQLRDLYANAQCEVEGEWGFTKDWQPTGWMVPDTWARIKLDACVFEDSTSMRVIDFKTGKRFGNEISHGQQALIYAIAAFVRYPETQFIKTELWYLDKSETAVRSYSRDEALMFLPRWHERAVVMTTCTEFIPTPSKSACRWCSYKQGDQPECAYGV